MFEFSSSISVRQWNFKSVTCEVKTCHRSPRLRRRGLALLDEEWESCSEKSEEFV